MLCSDTGILEFMLEKEKNRIWSVKCHTQKFRKIIEECLKVRMKKDILFGFIYKKRGSFMKRIGFFVTKYDMFLDVCKFFSEDC